MERVPRQVELQIASFLMAPPHMEGRLEPASCGRAADRRVRPDTTQLFTTPPPEGALAPLLDEEGFAQHLAALEGRHLPY